MLTLTDHTALLDAILNAVYGGWFGKPFELKIGNVTYYAEPGGSIGNKRFYHDLPTSEWDSPAYSADLAKLAERLIDAETKLTAAYQDRLARLNPKIDEYAGRKPFAKARDSKEQKNRLNEQRTYTTILAELAKPREQREQIASYDIDCGLGRYMREA